VSTEQFKADRASRRAFLERHPDYYKCLLGKRYIPLTQWEKSEEAGEIYEAARSAQLYAQRTVRCDILSGLRGIAVQMLREVEDKQEKITAESKARRQEQITAEIIALLEGDGIDRTTILRRVHRHFRQH
jgi:hypothetical protein